MDWFFELGANPFLVGISVVVAGGAYIWLCRVNCRLAVALLVGLLVVLAYFKADWNYWNHYFKVDWSLKRY